MDSSAAREAGWISELAAARNAAEIIAGLVNWMQLHSCPLPPGMAPGRGSGCTSRSVVSELSRQSRLVPAWIEHGASRRVKRVASREGAAACGEIRWIRQIRQIRWYRTPGSGCWPLEMRDPAGPRYPDPGASACLGSPGCKTTWKAAAWPQFAEPFASQLLVRLDVARRAALKACAHVRWKML